MHRTTLGQLLVNAALPQDMRREDRVLDAKGIPALFDELAEKHPDRYRMVAKQLSDVGRTVAYLGGSFSFGLAHMRSPRAAVAARRKIEASLAQIHSSGLPDAEKERQIVALLEAAQKPMEDAVLAESNAEGNPLAKQIMSGARGKAMNLKSLRGGDILYEDHHGTAIPVPVLNPYSKGLTPVEYYAGSFGARKGVIDTKQGTQNAGYFGKQLVQATHDLVVTGNDYDDDEDRTHLGLPVDANDPDNEGALLARPAGGYGRNTVLTPKVMSDLAARGHPRILVRSPTVGGPKIGGVYARDVGVRERGGLSPRGDFVGIAGVQALAEKVTQGMLSSKHSGGVAGAGAATSGFGFVNNLIQAPKTFAAAATHAQRDGRVDSVREAPQGGHYVSVSGEDHYVPHGHDVTVAEHDEVEAGDALSDGVPNPAEVVHHKGIGEGRRYFVQAFHSALKRSGVSAHRRNVELLATGLVNHVEFNAEHGGHLPGDVARYSDVAAAYEPRDDARSLTPTQAVGKYLERPVLHYTVGTKVRKSMLPTLAEFKVNNVYAHDDPPPFEPLFVRGMATLANHPDWMTRHLGSGLQKATLDAVHRGLTSSPEGTSYVPAVAARNTFGTHGLTQGWEPRDADRDGMVFEGTLHERPARKAAAVEEGPVVEPPDELDAAIGEFHAAFFKSAEVPFPGPELDAELDKSVSALKSPWQGVPGFASSWLPPAPWIDAVAGLQNTPTAAGVGAALGTLAPEGPGVGGRLKGMARLGLTGAGIHAGGTMGGALGQTLAAHFSNPTYAAMAESAGQIGGGILGGLGGYSLLGKYKQTPDVDPPLRRRRRVKAGGFEDVARGVYSHLPNIRLPDSVVGAGLGGLGGYAVDAWRGQDPNLTAAEQRGRRNTSVLAGAALGMGAGNLVGDRVRRYAANSIIPTGTYDSGKATENLYPKSLGDIVDRAILDRPAPPNPNTFFTADLSDMGHDKALTEDMPQVLTQRATTELIRRQFGVHTPHAATDYWLKRPDDTLGINTKNPRAGTIAEALYTPPAQMQRYLRDPQSAIVSDSVTGEKNNPFTGGVVGGQELAHTSVPGGTLVRHLDRFDTTVNPGEWANISRLLRSKAPWSREFWKKELPYNTTDYAMDQRPGPVLKALTARYLYDNLFTEANPWVKGHAKIHPDSAGINVLQPLTDQGTPLGQPRRLD